MKAVLSEIRTLLQHTTAALSELQLDIARYPDELGLLINANSLQKRQQELEEDFMSAASSQGEPVCSYRLFSETSPSITALSKALLDFQAIFSLTYSARRTGPRARARIGAGISKETAFTFGYTFAGSLGVVFTLPTSEPGQEEQNRLDETIKTVFGIAKAKSPIDVARFAQELGRPPIKAAFTWAKDHALYGLGASIKWYPPTAEPGELMVERPELEHLRDIIDQSSEETTEEITVEGLLVAADVRRKTFRLSADDGRDIRGHFDQAINEEHTVTLPQRYIARLRMYSKVALSTGEEKIDYQLLQLDPPRPFSER